MSVVTWVNVLLWLCLVLQPFGWVNGAQRHQSYGMYLTSYLRSRGRRISQYIDE